MYQTKISVHGLDIVGWRMTCWHAEKNTINRAFNGILFIRIHARHFSLNILNYSFYSFIISFSLSLSRTWFMAFRSVLYGRITVFFFNFFRNCLNIVKGVREIGAWFFLYSINWTEYYKRNRNCIITIYSNTIHSSVCVALRKIWHKIFKIFNFMKMGNLEKEVSANFDILCQSKFRIDHKFIISFMSQEMHATAVPFYFTKKKKKLSNQFLNSQME